MDPASTKPLPLTSAEASHRRSCIGGTVSYTLAVVLTKTSTYTAQINIDVQLIKSSPSLFLDFYPGADIRAFQINGKLQPPDNEGYSRGRLLWPLGAQRPGTRNVIQIVYAGCYDEEGDGFYHCCNGLNKHFFHVQAEPFFANRAYPCFDQPDIKARYRLFTFTPVEWTVVSNEMEEAASISTQGSYARWLALYGIDSAILPEEKVAKLRMRMFKRTRHAISTYLFTIVAGEYQVSVLPAEKDVPQLRIFYRPPNSPELIETLLKLTQQGIRIMQDFLQTPFPFAKYDQCFIPNLKEGAMENAGCATFESDLLIEDRLNLHYLILHELAHHWFGNMVTPVWWTDTWLNEGFATVFGRLCQELIPEAAKVGNPWQVVARRKWRFYQYHNAPLNNAVESTEKAEEAFSNVAYEKGGAVLRQLMYTVGEPAIKAALHDYLEKFKWGNVCTADLIHILDQHLSPKLDVTAWADRWIYKGGMPNTIAAKYTAAKDGKIEKFEIVQTPDTDKILRPHTIRILMVNRTTEEWSFVDNVAIKAETKTEVPCMAGLQAPRAMFLNAEDYAIVLAKMDKASIEYFEKKTKEREGRFALKSKDVTVMAIEQMLEFHRIFH